MTLDRIANALVQLIKAVGVPVKGGYGSPCTNTFSKSYNAGAQVDEVSARLYQGILPDGVIDARDCDAGPFASPNLLVGHKILVEHKTLASLLISVQARAKKVHTDIQNRAKELDARHPGSFFVQYLASYGKCMVLVTGPFGSLSSDFILHSSGRCTP